MSQESRHLESEGELMNRGYERIPRSTLDSLQRYVEQGIPTGDFLRAVLSNDLMEALGRADEFNRAAIFEICQYIYNEMPHSSHGSPEQVTAWLQHFQEVPR